MNESRTNVLISVDDIGPLFGRLHVEHDQEDDVIELVSEHRAKRLSVVRVVVPAVPVRLIEALSAKINRLSGPVEVRVWDAVRPGHVSFRAYGTIGRDSLSDGARLALESHGALRTYL